MTPVNASDCKALFEQVGERSGWDFSRVNCVTEGHAPDFYGLVRKACGKSDLLLDIGTGGGEKVLPLASDVLLLVGIDQDAEMVETACRNAAAHGAPNVRFLRMEAERLAFPDGFFHVVSCRQSEFDAEEAARVLVPGGRFLTQQVSEGDKLNIKRAFGRETGKPGALRDRYIRELKEAGFRDIDVIEFEIVEYYPSPADLLFLLKHTPTVPDFGEKDEDFEILGRFIRENRTEKGIRTNMERFILTARKP
jgi:SAM-dependent methyltransferase